MFWKYLLGFFFIYAMIMWILPKFFFENLGWKSRIKGRLPKKVNEDMHKFGKECKTKEDVLDKVIHYELKRFYSKYYQYVTEFVLFYQNNIEHLWKKKGFLHCHQQNLILRYLLLETGRFTEDDIKIRETICYIGLHQYLQIRVEANKWINVDPFGMRLGHKKGELLKGSFENLFKK